MRDDNKKLACRKTVSPTLTLFVILRMLAVEAENPRIDNLMDAIRLRGFRSLVDTGMLELKPITVIVGQNSSGKSTFLRSLPLIAQSIATRSNSPILWYGDFVDFGEIADVTSSFSEDGFVRIDISLGEEKNSRRYRMFLRRHPNFVTSYEIGISLRNSGGRTELAGFRIASITDELIAEIKEKEITTIHVNGRDFSSMLRGVSAEISSKEFVPQVDYLQSGLDDEEILSFATHLEPAIAMVTSEILGAMHGKTSRKTAREIAESLEYSPEPFFTERLRVVSNLKTWKTFTSKTNLASYQSRITRIRELLFLSDLPRTLEMLQRRVEVEASGISYIGPARAHSERYYRIRELAVDKIDPRGENLAMFLNSLDELETRAFSSWLEARLGYAIKVFRNEGHIQLHLREEGSNLFHNLADTGYGFSQILPVLAQVWARGLGRGRPSMPATSVVAIEQPELHLHPAYQSALADIFASSVSKNSANDLVSGGNSKFIIETHSEALINRFGELIFEGELNAEDVVVYLFNKDDDSEETSVSVARFDGEGLLVDWPSGFFSSKL